MQRKKWRDATENGWVERLFAVNYHKTLLHMWRLVPIIFLTGKQLVHASACVCRDIERAGSLESTKEA